MLLLTVIQIAYHPQNRLYGEFLFWDLSRETGQRLGHEMTWMKSNSNQAVFIRDSIDNIKKASSMQVSKTRKAKQGRVKKAT